MRRDYGTVSIFAEIDLSNYLRDRIQNVINSINQENDDYLLNVNENDYVRHKSDEAKVEPLEIHHDLIYVSSSERMIPSEDFPRSHWGEPRRNVMRDVITFHIPFSGDQYLLRCRPSMMIMWSLRIKINANEFTFEIVNYNNDVERISREKDSEMRTVLGQLKSVTSDVDRYNSSIQGQIKMAFESRKNQLLKKNNVLVSLGVPIKKIGGVSSTFSIPSPPKRKRISIAKPTVTEVGFSPEPSLDNLEYDQILQIIHDVGRVFERLPSLYANKEEEHLRDHFLLMLEPNFEGSATGETFNKKGKTDILLRHEGSNVFIAECKFWTGKKGFLDTISQLLGYLTWRDSKASVIMFVPNKDFTAVLDTAKQEIINHPNYVEFLNVKDDTWLNYKFHLNDDRNRLVSMAIMLYHIPK